MCGLSDSTLLALRRLVGMRKLLDTLPPSYWAKRSCYPQIFVLWPDEQADDPIGLVDIDARQARLTPDAPEDVALRLNTCGITTERQPEEVQS